MSDQKELIITRTFDAPKELVWKAWTTPELLVKWWGPRGFTSPECRIDLREGGKYLYAMKSPEGLVMWSGGTFHEVIPYEKIVLTDHFADEHGNKKTAADFGMSEDFPAEFEITVTFEEIDGITKLQIKYPLPESQAARETMLKSGMKEGWGESLDKMAEVIQAEKKYKII